MRLAWACRDDPRCEADAQETEWNLVGQRPARAGASSQSFSKGAARAF